MNILREIRRIKKRSMPARILLIVIFSVILIIIPMHGLMQMNQLI